MANMAYIITHEKKEPFHYKKMYKQITHGSETNNNISKQTRNVENFRNQLDYYDYRFKRLEGGYFTLTEWVQPQTLIHTFPKISYDLSLEVISKAMIDAGHRLPYMLNKYNDDPKTRGEKVYKGKTNEFETIDYFKKKYGEYIETPNKKYNQYDKWDFRFNYGKIIRFDAKTIGKCDERNAVFIEKNRIYKNWADVFLSVASDKKMYINGYILKDDIKKAKVTRKHYIFYEETWHNPCFLETYLNHLIHGFDEQIILQNGFHWRRPYGDTN